MLDAKLRERLRLEIGTLLKKFAITTVYVTRNQQETIAFGDRIAVMEQGRIAQIDTSQTIYQRLATRFVGAINSTSRPTFTANRVSFAARRISCWRRRTATQVTAISSVAPF